VPTLPAPRTSFSFTGGQPLNLVVDPVRQLIWTTNTVLNEVDVLDMDGKIHARIPVPQPAGIDIMADNSTVVIGSFTSFIYMADPVQLRITRRVPMPARTTLPNYAMAPVLLLTAANGKVLIFGETANAMDQGLGESAIIEWDPAAGTFTDRTSEAQMPGVVARSADHTLIAIGNAYSPGHLVAYYAASDSFAISSDDFHTNFVSGIAVNPSGTQIAVWGYGLELFDRSLNLQNTIGSPGIYPLGASGTTYGGAVYSADGSHLYGSITTGDVAAWPWGFAVMDMNTLAVSELPYGHDGIPSAVAGSGLVVTTGTGGVGFVDPSRAPVPAVLDLQPDFPDLTPGNGSVNQVKFDHFSSADDIYVGTQPVCNDGTNITVPAGSGQGPVNVTGVSPTGWVVVAANAYSFGPALRQLSPNAAPAGGGTPVDIFGYGLNYDPAQITVTVGGQRATVLTAGYSPQGDETDLDRLEVTVPPGTPGWAEVTVTTPDGSNTLPRGLYYAAGEPVFPSPEAMTWLQLDRTRQRIYGLGSESVEVFDIASGAFVSPIALPGITSGARLDGLALTPDGSTLAISDATDHEILTLNPDQPGSVTATAMPAASGCVMTPAALAADSLHRLMVVTNCNAIEALDLATLTWSQVFSGSIGQSPMAATPDGSVIWGNGLLWTAATGEFAAAPAGFSLAAGGANSALSDDGAVLETDGQSSPAFFDRTFALTGVATLPDYVPGGPIVSAGQLDPTGALDFVPLSGAVDVFDTVNGSLRMRIPLPQAVASSPGNVMVFADGSQRLYMLTQSGMEEVDLGGGLPLAVGEIQPSGPVAPGSSLTLRGTGFMAATKVQMNGATVGSTLLDAHTIEVTVPALAAGPVPMILTNPDGQSFRWDAAFSVH